MHGGKSSRKVVESQRRVLKDKDGKHIAAANRLQMVISGECHDIFAADVYYHNSCYLKFTVNPIIQQVENKSKMSAFKKILLTS